MTVWTNPATVASDWTSNDNNVGALLQESGGFLLQENGDLILLETTTINTWTPLPANPTSWSATAPSKNPWTKPTPPSNSWS